MSDPFPLSQSDHDAFMAQMGSTLQLLPSWGGIYQWNGRYILAYVKPDYTAALTDISGGIPDSSVPGGYIPVSVLLTNVPRTETPSWEVFLYSLPSNFYQVAKERMQDLANIAVDVAHTTGEAAGSILGESLNPIGGSVLIPLAVVAAIVFGVMYLPKKKAAA